MLLQLSLDICMCQGILNWQACTLQLWLTGESHILGWLCSCARIMQQMFCSQKKSVHSWELSRLCPWFLQVRFPLEAMSWPWAPQHCWAQLHRGKSCVEHGKREGLLGLFAWVLALSSACAPRTCPSHDSCARQCILTRGCSPASLAPWLISVPLCGYPSFWLTVATPTQPIFSGQGAAPCPPCSALWLLF